MLRGTGAFTALLVGLLIGCGEDATSSESEQALVEDLPVGPASSGDMFINVCRPSNGSLVCALWRMTVFPGATPRTKTTQLPAVTQPITHARQLPGLIALPGLVGSTVDPSQRRVYWHADCNEGYHVTDIDTGETESFAIDLGALGIEDDGRGFCLGEWAYDDRRQRAIALAGRQDRNGGLSNEKSTVEYALTVDASGGVEILHDLRDQVDQGFRFLHEFQTIASLDPDRDEMIAPVVLPATGEEDQIMVNLTSGQVSFVGTPNGRQHRFFDVAKRAHTAFNCAIRGLTSQVTGNGPARVTIGATELAQNGIHDICGGGFVGGGYDPIDKREYLLMRTQQISPAGKFLLGRADMVADRWMGLFQTDATYGALGLSSVGAARLFLATEFVPAPPSENGGLGGTIARNEERRFKTASLPPGAYKVSITGTGDADLYVRRGAQPTTTSFHCRPFLAGSSESCQVTLTAPQQIHVMVRGFAATSTFRLVAE